MELVGSLPWLLSRFLLFLLVPFLLVTCSSTDVETPTAIGADAAPTSIAERDTVTEGETEALAGVPAEARVATRPGDPRTAAYWVLWNSCAPDNRSETAVVNGGRAAGWFIMDDFLADPGIQLGDFPVMTCAEGLALLPSTTSSVESIDNLAGQLLAAELNLNAGAETCPIAEETVITAHIILARLGFQGVGKYEREVPEEVSDAVPRVTELLATYNRGELCR